MRSRALDLIGKHVALIVILGAMLLPVVVMLGTSLKSMDQLFTWPPRLFPSNPQWQNYAEVWGGRYQYSRAFTNSVIIAVFTSLLSVLLGAPAAYGANRFKFRGSSAFMFGVLATQMISPVVFIVPLYKAMRAYHLLNTLTSVIIASTAFAVPMVIWLLHGYFSSIPKELEEAAMVDGCSRARAMVQVILPLAAPGLAAAAIYAFIMGWNQLMFPLAFLTRSELRPIPLALYDFSGYNIVFWHHLMAASMIAVVPAAIAFALVQRYLVSGLTAGAVKS
ncbi:carbohydrate ABC transporter permease [Carboxydochorda subterranea]|uniref:Carbohydrate ABC transporter permease n=1 Tax=Carboxydichorda subterranea TaxID=3109565 RepID=A0ABZ1BXN1_9FIRM|nr:carbohydrate ABC transporter permease [Limnochorda sp. L945t]WRP17561.1 carbohydrate ABC transporter permease [Limnochorda sp. L945t]